MSEAKDTTCGRFCPLDREAVYYRLRMLALLKKSNETQIRGIGKNLPAFN
jgi:hypothetical protein